jgi:hypothetical protein
MIISHKGQLGNVLIANELSLPRVDSKSVISNISNGIVKPFLRGGQKVVIEVSPFVAFLLLFEFTVVVGKAPTPARVKVPHRKAIL